MADQLKSGGFVVQQTLHGYSDGHRLIEGCAVLPPQDSRLMLVLSDASSTGSSLPSIGYLTGYPLGGSGKYVLARTWPAPEMPRPGCVWTHSLLIDFGDLATITSFGGLLQAFVRPDPLVRYDRPVFVSAEPDTFWRSVNIQRAPMLLGDLYGSPRARVFAKAENFEDDEALVLSIWMQQWPRLRRAFRFCTFVSVDRSQPSEHFDLQLTDRVDVIRRGHSARLLDAEDMRQPPSLVPLTEDLLDPNGTGLRSFLKRVGGDIQSGRAAMLPLSRLYSMLWRPGDVSSQYRDAFDLLEDPSLAGAHSVRIFVLERVVNSIDRIDDTLFAFVLSRVATNTDVIPQFMFEMLGRALWKRSPLMFVGSLTADSPLRIAADSAVSSLDEASIASAARSLGSAICAVAERRPDLLVSEDFWRSIAPNAAWSLCALVRDDQVTRVISAMVASGRDDLTFAAVQRFGVARVLDFLNEAAHQLTQDVLAIWCRQLLDKAYDLANELVSPKSFSVIVLLSVARVAFPDALPNIGGVDPWVQSLTHAHDQLDFYDEMYLGGFLLARGLGTRTNSPSALLALALPAVYSGLATNRLDDAAWRLFSHKLTWGVSGQATPISRTLQTVVDHFVDYDLDCGHFNAMARSDDLFNGLTDIAAKRYRGRRYLERLKNYLILQSTIEAYSRAGYLDKLL